MNTDIITLNLVKGLIISYMILLFIFPISLLIILDNYYYLLIYVIVIPAEILILKQFKEDFY
jgi:hypothetical protein